MKEMVMKKYAVAAALVGMAFGNQAFAHVGYANLDNLNPFVSSVTSDHGWSDGAGTTWGDSHHLKWYSFTLAADTDVKIEVSALAAGTYPTYSNATGVQGSTNGIPNTFTTTGALGDVGFSLYRGLFPQDFKVYENANWDDDNNVITPNVLTYSVEGHAPAGSTGLFNANGNVTMGNDKGAVYTIDWLSAVNDNTGATETLFKHLTAGYYSLAVGGLGGISGDKFAVSAQVSAVPVPAAVWLFGSALAGMGVIGRRKQPEQAA